MTCARVDGLSLTSKGDVGRVAVAVKKGWDPPCTPTSHYSTHFGGSKFFNIFWVPVAWFLSFWRHLLCNGNMLRSAMLGCTSLRFFVLVTASPLWQNILRRAVQGCTPLRFFVLLTASSSWQNILRYAMHGCFSFRSSVHVATYFMFSFFFSCAFGGYGNEW